MVVEIIQASNVVADDSTMLELKPHISVNSIDKTVSIQSKPSDPALVGTFDTQLVVRFRAFELTQDIPLRVTVTKNPCSYRIPSAYAALGANTSFDAELNQRGTDSQKTLDFGTLKA